MLSAFDMQILDAINDMVLVKGPKSKIIWGNKAFRNLYGMSNDELRDLIDAPFNEPDYTQQYIRDDEWVFSNGSVLDIPLEHVKRYDGQVRLFHTVKSPIFDEKGEVVMTVGVSRDITERVASEKLIAEQQAKMVAASKLSSLGEMAGSIAHEINNPLSIISGRVQQLNSMLQSGEVELNRVGKYLTDIERTTNRISTIVKGLRKFARDSSSDPFSVAHIYELLDDTMGLCTERMKNSGVQLVVNVDNPNQTLECRPSEIVQVLLNLLNNAFDAVMSVSGEKKITVDLITDEKVLSILVTDTGPGIPPEIRSEIMQPFFTTKPIGLGTGLGLSISQSIIRTHGGDLVLEDQLFPTKFRIRLPLRQGQPQNSSQSSNA